MPKAYWVATYKKIGNTDNLKNYAIKATEIIKTFGAEPLVRGGIYTCLEGESYLRTVIWQFPNYDAAEKCYKSSAYQEAWNLAKRSTERNFQIVEGV